MQKKRKGAIEPSSNPPEDLKLLPKEKQVAWQDGYQKHVILGLAVFAFVAFLGVLYFLYLTLKRYWLSRDVKAHVQVVGPSTPKVGETITVRIMLKKDGMTPSTPEIKELEENIVIEPFHTSVNRKIGVLKEKNAKTGRFEYKFSVRHSGVHHIKVWFYMFSIDPEVPFNFHISPGPVSPKYVDFYTHNANILRVTEGETELFPISLKDEYENRCIAGEVQIEDLDFQVFHMGRSFKIEHGFCVREIQQDKENNANLVSCVVLEVKVNVPGIYNCFLKYRDYEVRSSHGGPKILICMSVSEQNMFQETISAYTIPGTYGYTTQCKLSTVKEEEKDFYAGISADILAFAYYSVPLRLYPDMKFLISDRLKIVLQSSSEKFGGESSDVTFRIHDGLQPPLLMHVSSSTGRLFLAVFANYQGFIITNHKKPFKEKRSTLKSQLSSYFFWAPRDRVLKLQRGQIVESSIEQLADINDEWLIPYRIIYESDVPQKKLPAASIGVKDWLNQLCDALFGSSGSHCIFQTLENSKLVHPMANKSPQEWYRLAGQVVAKGIVDALVRDIFTRVNELRLTRSLLGFTLGIQITYKCLETDEPKYFSKLLTILQSDMTDKNYTFTTLPSEQSQMALNLIADGSTVRVTNTNKEQYLNLLAQYRLIHKVAPEMAEFRRGFYDVIDKELLVDFDEIDLQNLISGSRDFVLEDLKKHHRVLMEADTGYSYTLSADIPRSNRRIDSNKLLEWFWTAVENFSDEERGYLMFFTTGSYSIPPQGFVALSPPFTISLTGTFQRLPVGNPQTHEIVLSDHQCFDNFEKTLLLAIKPAWERALKSDSSLSRMEDTFINGMIEDYDEQTSQNDRSSEIATISHYNEEELHRPNWNPLLQWVRECIGL